MRHENVLRFIGAERRGNHPESELWLVSEFHERVRKENPSPPSRSVPVWDWVGIVQGSFWS